GMAAAVVGPAAAATTLPTPKSPLPLPRLCPLPPKGRLFHELGRHDGPRAVAYHGGQRVISSPSVQAQAPHPELFSIGQYTLEPNIGVTPNGAILVDAEVCDRYSGTQ